MTAPTILTDIRTAFSRLPLGVVESAYFTHNPQPTVCDKTQKVYWLADKVAQGYIQYDAVVSAIPAPHTMSNGADSAKVDAASQVANRAEQLALTLTGELSTALARIGSQAADLAVLNDRIDAVKIAVDASRVDDTAVQYEVARAIADAFAPFKQAVVEAGAESAVADLAAVHVTEVKSAFDVFGVTVCDHKGNDLMVEVWNHPAAPAVDDNFIWTDRILRHLLLSQNTGENLWFGGDKGTGKSETARQFAARTGRAYTRINFHKYTTADDYAGAIGLENGATVFKRGDFLTAFTHPSSVILLDEVSNADQGELATLNGFLEPNSAVSYGGSVQRRAPGVLVFAADNTLGNGDSSGRYSGTRTMNSALVDRFARVIKFDYLDKSDEVSALMRHTKCNQVLASHVVDLLTACRAKVMTSDIIDAPSIRSAMAFIRALPVLPIADAWNTTIAARQPEESAAALESIRCAYVNETLIQSNT
jgi:MoxR-like ATPase